MTSRGHSYGGAAPPPFSASGTSRSHNAPQSRQAPSPRRRVPPEGLLIESDDAFLLPGLSPGTFHERVEEFRQMGAALQYGGGGVENSRNVSTLLVPLPAPPPPRSRGSTPPTPMPIEPISKFAATARSLGRMAKVGSVLSPASRPRFLENPFGDPNNTTSEDNGGLARVPSSLQHQNEGNAPSRKRSIFGDFNAEGGGGGDGTNVAPPADLGRRRTSLVRDQRRGSTFGPTGAAAGGAGGSGLGSLEHHLFRAAPSAVLAKLSSFVTNRNGDGGSWQKLSDLIDLYRKGSALSQEPLVAQSTGKLKYSADHYPSRILSKATNRRTGNTAAIAGDNDSEDELLEGGGGMAKSRRQQTEQDMMEEWQTSIATSVAMLNNVLGLVTNSVPSLTPACDSLRRVLLSAVFHNGRNLGTVLPLPTSIDACGADMVDTESLKKKLDLFSVDPFSVISVEADLRKIMHRHQHAGGANGGAGTVIVGGGGGGGESSLLDAVKTVRQLKRRFAVMLQFLTFNMDGWRRLALGCVFKTWRASRIHRIADDARDLEIGNMRAELEFLTNSKKTQQAELNKVNSDRSAVTETAEMERASLRETYEKNIKMLETQVTNLKQHVQNLKKNSEADVLKVEIEKYQETNAKLEEQVVKLVEHIAKSEAEIISLKQKLATASGSVAAVSRQLSAVTSQLSANIHIHKPTLAKIASLATSGSSIPPLAQWLTECAQTAVGKEAVQKALVEGLGEHRDGAAPTLSLSDLHNVSIRQALVRVRDFTDGPQVLDAYACAMHFLDEAVIPPSMVADVMLESDVLSKAQFVLEYANILFTQSTRFRVLGGSNTNGNTNALRNPSSFLSSSDLAFAPTIRSHLLMVSSLIALWVSTMCTVSLVPFGEGDPTMDMFLTRPLELETLLEAPHPGAPCGTSEVLSVCSTRWEAVKECFVVWRNAMLALPSILIDYAAESQMSLIAPLPTISVVGAASGRSSMQPNGSANGGPLFPPGALGASTLRSGSFSSSVTNMAMVRKDSTTSSANDNAATPPTTFSPGASPSLLGALTPHVNASMTPLLASSFLAPRRHSALIKPLQKSPDERMLIAQPNAKAQVLEAVKAAFIVALPHTAKALQSNGNGKQLPAVIVAPGSTGSSDASTSSQPMSDEERIQLSTSTIVRRFEEEAGRLVAIFHYYATPSSDVAAHLPILVFGAPQAAAFCSDVGLSASSLLPASAAVTLALSTSSISPAPRATSPQHKVIITEADCREIISSIVKKRNATGPPNKTIGNQPTVCSSKKNDEVLRSSLLLEEFPAFLIRLASKCGLIAFSLNPATPQPKIDRVDSSKMRPAATVTATMGESTASTVGGADVLSSTLMITVSHDRSTSASSSGTAPIPSDQVPQVALDIVADSTGDFLLALEEAVGSVLLPQVVLPHAYRFDNSFARLAVSDPSVTALLDEYKSTVALMFRLCASAPETGATTIPTSSIKTNSSSKAKTRSIVSQSQFRVLVAELTLYEDTATSHSTLTPPSGAKPPQPLSLPAAGSETDIAFSAVQPIDNTRPMLLTSSDFGNALVVLALLWKRQHAEILVHHTTRIARIFERLYLPFIAAKFPKESSLRALE